MVSIKFSDTSTTRIFNDNTKHHPTVTYFTKTKIKDGPNEFSIYWNQIVILWITNNINDYQSLKSIYNEEIFLLFSDKIINEINKLIFKLENINIKYISLYYDTFRINKNNIYKLKELLKMIQYLQK